MSLYSAFTTVATVLLGLKVAQLTYGVLSALYALLARPAVNLTKYGQWAVVTGSTDGIGKAYAFELAKRKLNLVLISRSKDKLDAVAKEITDQFQVQVKVIAFDFSNGWSVDSVLAKELSSLDIGILVNNVGVSYEYPEFLLEVPASRIKELVDINMVSLVEMTRTVLPNMVKNKRGAIINVSSGSSVRPCPMLAVYAASKAFVDNFSRALSTEYASKGIFVQALVPFFVASKMSKMKPSLFIPSAESYAKQAVKTIGYETYTHGHIFHKLLGFIVRTVPYSISQSQTLSMHLDFRKRYFAKKEKAEKAEKSQ